MLEPPKIAVHIVAVVVLVSQAVVLQVCFDMS
jgi:hypothetical protein